MTSRLQVCTAVGVLYNTCLGGHRGWEDESGGLKHRYRSSFLHFFRHSLTHYYILKAKKTVFFDNWVFLKNHPFCDITEINSFFLNIFQNNGKKSIYLKSPKKS